MADKRSKTMKLVWIAEPLIAKVRAILRRENPPRSLTVAINDLLRKAIDKETKR